MFWKRDKKDNPQEEKIEKPKHKKLVSVIAFVCLLLIVGTLIWAFATYLINNAYTAKVLTDLKDTVKGGTPLDKNSLLTLERVYELRTGLAKTDILSFLYPVFSAIFLTIGLFILGQVTASQEKISKQTNEFTAGIKKDKDDLKKDNEKIIEDQNRQLSQIAKEQQAISNLIYYESELMKIHVNANLLRGYIRNINEFEIILVAMRDSKKELEQLIKNLKPDVGCINPERWDSADRQMNVCFLGMALLSKTRLRASLKVAIERYIEDLKIVHREYRKLFTR